MRLCLLQLNVPVQLMSGMYSNLVWPICIQQDDNAVPVPPGYPPALSTPSSHNAVPISQPQLSNLSRTADRHNVDPPHQPHQTAHQPSSQLQHTALNPATRPWAGYNTFVRGFGVLCRILLLLCPVISHPLLGYAAKPPPVPKLEYGSREVGYSSYQKPPPGVFGLRASSRDQGKIPVNNLAPKSSQHIWHGQYTT